MKRRSAWARRGAAVSGALALLLGARESAAEDLGVVAGSRVDLEVTETSIVSQRFDARDNERPEDSGWGQWLNRVDTTLRWGHWTAGLRLDSALYWRRPRDNPDFGDLPPAIQQQVLIDDESRYESSIYPAKMWATYAAPGVEVTVGDAYAQFGRGLTLSLRKIDELGIDTTVRGGKVEIQKDPFAVTAVAGFGNPSRVDEASGRSLFPTHDLVFGDRAAPVFGSDRLLGLDLQAGRGLPLTFSTHAVMFTRCAPYRYDASGNIVTDFAADPATVTFGTCDDGDTRRWLASLGSAPPGLSAHQITMVGQSIEVPSLDGHGKLYVEAAAQQRRSELPIFDRNADGNAIYGALSFDAGRLATTLEVKSNRNFYVVPASVSPGQAAVEFGQVAYSFLPPAETFNMIDAETGNFNACVNGGRFRLDADVTPHRFGRRHGGDQVMVYAQGIYAYTQSENTSGGCDALGRTRAAIPAYKAQDVIYDGVAGLEWYFDHALSHVFFWGGARDDSTRDGDFEYDEQHLEYSVVAHLTGPWSIEVQGRHRRRRQLGESADWWTEGENYVALKFAPRWVVTQGFEYTTLAGAPPFYVNGAVLYKWTSASNVRVFVGQQRGAFRCASGICRFFPPFEGARAELTWRF